MTRNAFLDQFKFTHCAVANIKSFYTRLEINYRDVFGGFISFSNWKNMAAFLETTTVKQNNPSNISSWMNLRLGRSYEDVQSVLDQQVCLITLEVEEVIHSKPQFGDLSDSKK